jgi:hypothetical protein
MPNGHLTAALSLAALVALACSSCAWTPHDQSAAADDDEGYVPTGSHIPRKVSQGSDRGVGTMNSQDAHDMMVKPAAAPQIHQ